MAEWIAEFKYHRYDEFNNVINDIFRFSCSECGWTTGQQGITFQFCPKCGKPMKNANRMNVFPLESLEDMLADIDGLKKKAEKEYCDGLVTYSEAVEDCCDIVSSYLKRYREFTV